MPRTKLRRQRGGHIPPFVGSNIQFGGYITPYAGASHQYGFGLGDVLRGIFRSIIPYVAPVATNMLGTFLTEAGRGFESGKSAGESFKSALKPAANAGLTSYVKTYDRKRRAELDNDEPAQIGQGKRRRKVYKAKRKTIRKKHLKRHKLHIQDDSAAAASANF